MGDVEALQGGQQGSRQAPCGWDKQVGVENNPRAADWNLMFVACDGPGPLDLSTHIEQPDGQVDTKNRGYSRVFVRRVLAEPFDHRGAGSLSIDCKRQDSIGGVEFALLDLLEGVGCVAVGAIGGERFGGQNHQRATTVAGNGTSDHRMAVGFGGGHGNGEIFAAVVPVVLDHLASFAVFA